MFTPTVCNTITITQTPTVSLVKTDSFPPHPNYDRVTGDSGDTVTYSYTVSNSGNVTLTGLTLTDDNGTPGTTSEDQNSTLLNTTHSPSTYTTVTYTKTLSQSDINAGKITNIATDSGLGPGNT